MKKYDLKRAMLVEVERSRLSPETQFFQHIALYQLEMAKLPKPIDRTNRRFLEIQREIQKLRLRSKSLRAQKFTFEVYVKQYRDTSIVDWTFQHYPPGPEYNRAFKEMLKEVTDQAIKNIRQNMKPSDMLSKLGKFSTTFFGKKKQGRVFSKPGEVLRIYVEKNLKSLYDDKRPVEPRKYIGIELEFCAPIKENEFAIKLFRSGIHKFAQLKKDGSLRPHEEDGEIGYELAILLEESNYKKRLKQITNVLKEVGAVAQDRRAGLHVHLDMRKRNKDLVYSNLVACQYALLSIVDPKRYNNEFCRVVDSRKFPTEFTGERTERYKTINAAAFYKYKTLEIRMHEGSVDYAQISNWVDLLVRIANYGKKFKNNVTKVSALKKRISLDKKLYGYIQDRSCYWQIQNDRNTQTMRQTLNHFEEIQALRAQVRAQGETAQPDRVVPTAPPGTTFRLDRRDDGLTTTTAAAIVNTGIRNLDRQMLLELFPPAANAADMPEEMNPEPHYLDDDIDEN